MGEEKSIIVWKYRYDEIKNECGSSANGPESDIEGEEIEGGKEKEMKNAKWIRQCQRRRWASTATKAFAGQIRPPTDFQVEL